MFLKLLKHELHETGRLLLPVFGGLLLMAGLARGSIALLQTSDSPVLSVTCILLLVFFILGCAAAVILTVVMTMLRYARSMYGDEGYLTHTLPVGIHSLLLSRLLVTALALAVSYGVVYLSVRIFFTGIKELNEFASTTKTIFGSMELDSTTLLWKSLLSITAQIFVFVLQLFAAISIGHSFNRGKTGKSILFYFLLSICSSLLSSLLQLLLLPRSYNVGAVASVSQSAESVFVFTLGYSLILCCIYYFIAWLMTRKHLNLA